MTDTIAIPDFMEHRSIEQGLDAYRSLPVKQQPAWQDEAAIEQVRRELRSAPPSLYCALAHSTGKRSRVDGVRAPS